ncbi:MAG: hypothetical protein N4A33_02780 [Bacteriovoracaceae bacterium]|nr:hypothetical protein [Bacteriovoracaceae bacterium]
MFNKSIIAIHKSHPIFIVLHFVLLVWAISLIVFTKKLGLPLLLINYFCLFSYTLFLMRFSQKVITNEMAKEDK